MRKRREMRIFSLLAPFVLRKEASLVSGAETLAVMLGPHLTHRQ